MDGAKREGTERFRFRSDFRFSSSCPYYNFWSREVVLEGPSLDLEMPLPREAIHPKADDRPSTGDVSPSEPDECSSFSGHKPFFAQPASVLASATSGSSSLDYLGYQPSPRLQMIEQTI